MCVCGGGGGGWNKPLGIVVARPGENKPFQNR